MAWTERRIFRRFGKIAKTKHKLPNFHLSARLSAWRNSASIGRIVMKFDIWVFFENTVEKIQVWLISDKNNRHFTWRPLDIFIVSRSDLLRMRNVTDKFVEEIKTHILCPITCFQKSCRLWDNVEKYCRVGQATDDNMAHARYMMDTYDYKHSVTVCNTHYFFTATVTARTRLNIMSYVNSLSCF